MPQTLLLWIEHNSLTQSQNGLETSSVFFRRHGGFIELNAIKYMNNYSCAEVNAKSSFKQRDKGSLLIVDYVLHIKRRQYFR